MHFLHPTFTLGQVFRLVTTQWNVLRSRGGIDGAPQLPISSQKRSLIIQIIDLCGLSVIYTVWSRGRYKYNVSRGRAIRRVSFRNYYNVPSVKLLGRPMIIINSAASMAELDKGAIYSDRPILVLGGVS